MPDSDDGRREWVRNWLERAPKLEEIRRRQLRTFDHEKHAQAIDALLQIGCQFARPRSTSGLVEQQRLFKKARP